MLIRTPSVTSPSTTPPTILAALPMCSTSNRFALQQALDDGNGALDRLRDCRTEPHRAWAVLVDRVRRRLAAHHVHPLEPRSHGLCRGERFDRVHRMRLD